MKRYPKLDKLLFFMYCGSLGPEIIKEWRAALWLEGMELV